MSGDENDDTPKRAYSEENRDENGDYIVGRGRPPKSGQFAVNDGRKRGRRPKGQRNLETIIAEEASRKVTIREGGKERKVTKLEAVVIRAFDNASAKGQISAITYLINLFSLLMEKKGQAFIPKLEGDEQALVDAWLLRRMADLERSGDLGDPEELPADSEDLHASGHGDTEEADHDE